MRATIPIVLAIALLCACPVWAQQFQMYDRSYAGPTNYYGQPTFKAMPRPQGRAQQPDHGAVPLAIYGVQRLGGYLWSYMPAPVRGQKSPYVLPPDSGQVTITAVPGGP
ncbi:MAG: hypothetical protein P8182_08365 [Deltaproteobacteria bacterium]